MDSFSCLVLKTKLASCATLDGGSPSLTVCESSGSSAHSLLHHQAVRLGLLKPKQ